MDIFENVQYFLSGTEVSVSACTQSISPSSFMFRQYFSRGQASYSYESNIVNIKERLPYYRWVKVKVKFFTLQALEALRVARG
jgi:hypothetical protein